MDKSDIHEHAKHYRVSGIVLSVALIVISMTLIVWGQRLDITGEVSEFCQ